MSSPSLPTFYCLRDTLRDRALIRLSGLSGAGDREPFAGLTLESNDTTHGSYVVAGQGRHRFSEFRVVKKLQ